MKRTLIQRVLQFLADYFYKLERKSYYKHFRAKREDIPQEVVDLSDMMGLHISELQEMKYCVDDLWNRLPTHDYKENIRIWTLRYWELQRLIIQDMWQHLEKRYPDHLEWGDEKDEEYLWLKASRKKPRE